MSKRAAILVFLGVLAVASTARANTCPDTDPDGCVEFVFPMSALFFIAGDIVFLTLDGVYAGRRRIMPPAWAVPELIFGVLTLGDGAAMAALAAIRPGHPVNDVLYGGATAAFAIGAWFLGHAIVSLIHLAIQRATPASRWSPYVCRPAIEF